MNKWLPLVLLIALLTACAVQKKTVKSTHTSTYSKSENQEKDLVKESYRFYSDRFKVHNTITYNASGEIELMDFNRDTPGYDRSFGMMWDSPAFIKENYDEDNIEGGIDTMGSYMLHHSDNNLNGKNVHVYFESPLVNFYRVKTFSDSLKMERAVILSKEVMDYYTGIRRMLMDSIGYQELIPFPDMKNCTTLVESTYEKMECLSKEKGLYKRTYVDSSYYDGELEIEKEEELITKLKSIEENGDITLVYKDDRKHITKFYKANDLANPYTATESFIIEVDTFYTIDLTTEVENGLRRSNYVIKEKKKEQNKSYGNLRLPLVHKEINVWRDQKTGEIVRTRQWARTSEGHILELDKGQGGKILKERLTLPEISKDQKYPIGFYPFYRLEIARYDKGYREPKVKDENVYYEDFVIKLQEGYERVESNKALMKEVWLSKDALNRVEVEYE
jgi:hypothetical protein